MRRKGKTFTFDFSKLDSKDEFAGAEREVLNAIHGFNLPIKHKAPRSLWDNDQKNGPVKIFSRAEIKEFEARN